MLSHVLYPTGGGSGPDNVVVGVVVGGVGVVGGMGASTILKLNLIHPTFPLDVVLSLTASFNM
jgi:hypothetical protein